MIFSFTSLFSSSKACGLAKFIPRSLKDLPIKKVPRINHCLLSCSSSCNYYYACACTYITALSLLENWLKFFSFPEKNLFRYRVGPLAIWLRHEWHPWFSFSEYWLIIYRPGELHWLPLIKLQYICLMKENNLPAP